MSDQNIFAALPVGRRIWAIAAIHGEVERLVAAHDRIAELMQHGDLLVYLGNYYGRGAAITETIDELLIFRRRFLSVPDNDSDGIVYLRGAQEEMWQKLLQLQFAPNPVQVLQWMLDQGVGATIAAYGGNPQEGFAAAREGILSLTRWTTGLRQAMRDRDGHTALMAVLRHAAFTADNRLLFVHAGIDPARPLSAQSDSFWWGGPGFDALTQPYNGFRLVVRGHAPRQRAFSLGEIAASIDGGCGFGGPLIAACFDADGNVQHVVEG